MISSIGVVGSSRWPEVFHRSVSGGRQCYVILRHTLQHIDIVQLQTLQAVLHGVEDVLATEPVLVDVADRVRVDIRREALANALLDLKVDLRKASPMSKAHICTAQTERTLVITTISSRGRLCCLMALPRMTSERPLL